LPSLATGFRLNLFAALLPVFFVAAFLGWTLAAGVGLASACAA